MHQDRYILPRKLFLISRYNVLFINDFYKKTGRNEFNEYPGLPKRAFHNSKYDNLYKLYAIMVAILYPILLTVKLFEAFIKTAMCRKRSFSGKNFFLATSIALPRVCKNAKIEYQDSYWLDVPWSYKSPVDAEYRLNYYELLSLNDIFVAYINAVRIFFFVLFKEGLGRLFLNINCYEWLLYYYMLDKLPKDATVYFCNHMDIWVPLLDSINVKKRILVQHGTEIVKFNKYKLGSNFYNYNKEYSFWSYNVPYKYKRIDFVYTFTPIEYCSLCNSILANRPDYEIVGYGIRLSEIKSEKYLILIIGFYRQNAEIEGLLLDSLSELDVKIMLKNHPTIPKCRYDVLLDKYDFEIIEGQVFPKPNLVLSYESTLALEYASLGVDVVYYEDLVLTKEDIKNTVISKINAYVK